MGISIDISGLESVDIDPSGLESEEDGFLSKVKGAAKSTGDAVANTVFPTSSKMEVDGVKSFAKRTGAAALDAASFPTRALGALRGFDVSDPKSALFQPEIEKVEEFSKDVLDHQIQAFADAAQEAEPGSFSQKMMLERQAQLQARKDEGKGISSLVTGATEIMREGPTAVICIVKPYFNSHFR